MIQRFDIPAEWDLGADPRYKRQNMERAMRGKVERGIVELITNADDSYRDLEDKGGHVSGKIRIEIERRRKEPSVIIVRDRAGGMNRQEMFYKLGTLGRRTSGFEKGKARRGLHGRGARDIAAFGTVHFESIKDEEYNHLIIPPSLKCRFTEDRAKKATQEIHRRLGILRDNGTVVTIEVDNRFKIPLHETLLEEFCRYYSLRDLFCSPNRQVALVDLNKGREDPLIYRYPPGEVVFHDNVAIPDYPGVVAELVIREHATSFEQGILPYREGILVKSAAAIHDCTYFGLDSEPFSWRFTGELCCEFVDDLIREYDDREEKNPDYPDHPVNNPIRLLDPFRDGLILEHPFTQALLRQCKATLKNLVDELKVSETAPKRDVTDENLGRKLDRLSKEISKVFERKVKELEEEILPGLADRGTIEKLPIGLHIIPPEEQPIIVNQPKTFTVVVKHYQSLDGSLPIHVISSDAEIRVRTSPIYFKKLLEYGNAGTSTFTVDGPKVGTEAFIEVRYDGYDNVVLVRVVEPSLPPELPGGLSFDKPLYHLRINKEKNLTLWLESSAKLHDRVIAEIASDHPEIVVKGGGRCHMRETGSPGVLVGNFGIVARQVKAKGIITGRVEGFEPASTRVTVEEHEPVSGVKLRVEPVDDDFGSVRYKWDENDPYLLKIGAKHPSIRRYLGIPTEQGYPGRHSPLYHTVLAEVIAEALAFFVLEKQFRREGQEGMLDYASADAYYHKHFSEFLSIAHKNLVEEPSYGNTK